ncbi:MAG: hypoxanthine phosphoribosyltransferase [Pseudomonadota bacterium]
MNRRLLISAADIDRRIRELGEAISRDYAGREPIMVGILKGAFIFMADLVRQVCIPVQVDFVGMSSYVGTESSGEVHFTKSLGLPIEGRDVIVVEDIVDTGLSLARLLEHLRSMGPRSVAVCALIDKRERRQADLPLSYHGFELAEGFLVGYGLDCDECYRNLPNIYGLEDT